MGTIKTSLVVRRWSFTIRRSIQHPERPTTNGQRLYFLFRHNYSAKNRRQQQQRRDLKGERVGTHFAGVSVEHRGDLLRVRGFWQRHHASPKQRFALRERGY